MTAHIVQGILGGLLLCAAAAMAADGARSESANPAESVPAGEVHPPAEAPTHLPAIEARDLSGRPVRRVHLDGKHTLLTFYFSSCVPCIQEVPALNAYREAHPELNYVAITFDPAADARRFVSERKLNWPVVADAGRFLRDAGVRSFPGYMLVAPDGRIIGRGAGLTLNAREETPGLAALERFVSRQLKAPQ
jgi:peroxiredoxin